MDRKYMLTNDRRDWDTLLEPWQHLLPNNATVLFLNLFGDVFLEAQDGSIHLLDAGADSVEEIAKSRLAFDQSTDRHPEWFLSDIAELCFQSGKSLKTGQVFSFTPPALLGGDYSVETAMPLDLEAHFDVLGQICRQLRNVPDGAQVEIKITE